VLVALVAITLAAVAIDIRTRVSVAAFGWIYLLVILPVTVRWGRAAGLLTAAASLFLLLTFLTEPRGLPYTSSGVDVIRLAISALGVTIAIILIDQVNRRLASSDRLLAAIVQSSEGAVTGETLEGSIVSWSLGAEHLYGFSAEEAVGRPVSLLLPTDRGQEQGPPMERLKLGTRIIDYETKRLTKDGRVLDVVLTLSPMRDAEGRVTGAYTVGRDVTAVRHVEAALRANDLTLSRAVEEIPDGVILLDDRGRVLLANEQARGFLGVRGAQTARFADLFANRFTLHPPVRWQAIAGAPSSTFLAVDTSGAPLRLRAELSRLGEPQTGRTALLIMTLRDATQQVEGTFQQLLRATQRSPESQPVAGVLAPLGGLGQARSLTPREAEVLRLIASGRSNQQIADELGITVNTIERHIANIYRKLQITSRTQATAYALNHGALVHPTDRG